MSKAKSGVLAKASFDMIVTVSELDEVDALLLWRRGVALCIGMMRFDGVCLGPRLWGVFVGLCSVLCPAGAFFSSPWQLCASQKG